MDDSLVKTGTVSIITQLLPDDVSRSVLHLINAIISAGQEDGVIDPSFKLDSIYCESVDQKQVRLVSKISYGTDERNKEASTD